MKSLVDYIIEKYKDKYGTEVWEKDDITLQTLQDAAYSGSFMNDRAWVYLDDSGAWVKIKKDGWQYQSNNQHVLGSTITTKELWEKIQKADEKKVRLLP